MTSLDDLPLETGRGEHVVTAPSAPSSPGPRAILLGVLVAASVAASVWFVLTRDRSAPASTVEMSASPPSSATTNVPAAAVLPPLGQMDPFVRSMLTSISSHPELLKWLATDDLVSAIATAIARLADGQTPARDLAVLRPSQGVVITRQGDAMTIDPLSHERYAPLVAAVTSVDAAKLAVAFQTLTPRIAEAYQRQGHVVEGFDDAVRRAIEVIATTPDVPPGAALMPGKGGYAYADPALESLPPAQKHVIRMGPESVRQVREAARRFGQALNDGATAR